LAFPRSGSRWIRCAITLNDDEALIAYAKPVVAELRANMVRVDSDFSATPFNSDKSRAGAKISITEH
jgi:hypothetical protein